MTKAKKTYTMRIGDVIINGDRRVIGHSRAEISMGHPFMELAWLREAPTLVPEDEENKEKVSEKPRRFSVQLEFEAIGFAVWSMNIDDDEIEEFTKDPNCFFTKSGEPILDTSKDLAAAIRFKEAATRLMSPEILRMSHIGHALDDVIAQLRWIDEKEQTRNARI